ncbi:MAG: methionine synthase [Oscillospiraceae bacterium]
MTTKRGEILAAALGNCVHVGGVIHFLALAEKEGYTTKFLGPAVSVTDFLSAVEAAKPEIAAVSYRLTPDNCRSILDTFVAEVRKRGLDKSVRFVFGGVRKNAEIAREYGLFEYISDGTDDIDDSIAFLLGHVRENGEITYPDNIVGRIAAKYPYPVLRHHFGLPSFDETLKGIGKIAESRVLDVVSIGPDQNTQQFFFKPEKRDAALEGAGGVPIHTREEFIELKKAAQCGNFPLLRCYSGTADVFDMAKMLTETIDNAWCAVPLCWYNEIDRRGTRTIEESVDEALRLIRWHAQRNIPVEVNEPHHWGLRDAHDVMPVVASYISAYNAKSAGVKNYISQYMFNNPNTLSFSMDLARVLAMIEMTESLCDDTFNAYREVRAGLPFLSGDLDVAKGQLAASTALAMNVHPHIIHVVGFSEAEQAATAEIVIESCKIVRGVIRSVLDGAPRQELDEVVQRRKEELVCEAQYTLNYITERYSSEFDDPLCEPFVIADCVKCGILDAPHIVKNEKFRGNLKTAVIGGASKAVDESGIPLTEAERLERLAPSSVK